MTLQTGLVCSTSQVKEKSNTALQVLTTSAVFLSTQPPLTSFLPYTIRTCYILALGSFAHALGGLLSGLAVVNIYEACDRIWAKDVCSRPDGT
jgi:hypothetical protein